MSSEEPSGTSRIPKMTGSFENKLSSPLHVSRAPSPSSIGPSSDNPTRWATEIFLWHSLKQSRIMNISPLNIVSVHGIDNAPTTVFATEAYTESPGSPMPVPSPKQFGSASDQGLETSSTVSDNAMLTIVISNYWSFSTYLWPPSGCRIRSNRYRSAQIRMSCLSSTLHHSIMLNYLNSQCYCITSETGSQFRSLISKLFSFLLDIVLECDLEDTDHPGPTTMNIQILSPERKTAENLVLKKISRLAWMHHGSVKL
jgi:hypothetical protein